MSNNYQYVDIQFAMENGNYKNIKYAENIFFK